MSTSRSHIAPTEGGAKSTRTARRVRGIAAATIAAGLLGWAWTADA